MLQVWCCWCISVGVLAGVVVVVFSSFASSWLLVMGWSGRMRDIPGGLRGPAALLWYRVWSGKGLFRFRLFVFCCFGCDR